MAALQGPRRGAGRARRLSKAGRTRGCRAKPRGGGQEWPDLLLHLQPARDAAASFPHCTLLLEGDLSSLSSPPPPSSQATFPAGGHAPNKYFICKQNHRSTHFGSLPEATVGSICPSRTRFTHFLRNTGRDIFLFSYSHTVLCLTWLENIINLQAVCTECTFSL